MRAQIGLADPSGGILVLMAFAAMALLAIVLWIVAVVLFFRAKGYRSWACALVFLGLVLASPALWFAWEMFAPELPVEKSWDFSASRDIEQLKEDKPAGSDYYYQGNIRSTVKLAGGRHWSGNAYLVVLRTKAGKITGMYWKSRPSEAGTTRELAARILKDLGLPAQGLDAWHQQARGGEPASLSIHEKTAPGESIEVLLRGSNEADSWAVHVNVRWDENR